MTSEQTLALTRNIKTNAEFYSLCNDENIDELNNIVTNGFRLNASKKKIVLNLCINNGKVKTLEWLFDNNRIVNQKINLFKRAVNAKQFEVAEWFYEHSNIRIKSLRFLTKNRDNDIRTWTTAFIEKENQIDKQFLVLCTTGSETEIIEYIAKYKRFIMDKTINKIVGELCSNNNLKILKLLNNHGLIKGGNVAFIAALKAGYMGIINWVYGNYSVRTQSIDLKKIKCSDRVKKFINDTTKNENMYFKFLGMCSNATLRTVRKKYDENRIIFNKQTKKDGGNIVFLRSSLNNLTVFKWFVERLKIQNNQVAKFLYYAIRNERKRFVQYIATKIDNRMNINIDPEFRLLFSAKKLDFIMYLLSLDFRVHNTELMTHMLIYGNLILAKRLQQLYDLVNVSNLNDLFNIAVEVCDLDKVRWMYGLVGNPYEGPIDSNYEFDIIICCDSGNVQVARWLASLYDRYQIFETGNGNLGLQDNLLDDSLSGGDDDDDDDEMSTSECCCCRINSNEIYEIVLENKDLAWELLGITKTCVNDNEDTCLICREKTQELIKLNCGHFGCVSCFAMWYKSNDEICIYCKKDIHWHESYQVQASNLSSIIDQNEHQDNKYVQN